MCDLCTMTATFDPKRHMGGSGFDGSMDGAIQATLYEVGDASSGRSTSYEMAVGDTFRGSLGWAGDRDWVAVRLTAGQRYEVAQDGVSLSDPYLRLYDSGGRQLGYNDDGGPGLNSLLRYTAPTTGTYYVAAGSFIDGYTGSYSLSVVDAGSIPDSSGTLDELARFLTHGFWGGTSRSFDTSGSNQITVNITALTEDGQKLARWAFEAWEAVANIDFVEVSGSARITFDDSASGAYASFSTSGSTLLSSNVNVGTSWLSTYGTTMSSYSFATYIHEIGHALGLGHQGDYNGSATYGIDDTYSNDSWQISIMSYFDQNENTTTNASRAWLISTMMSDVVAIQNLYGAPGASSQTAGNTTWGANSTLGGYLGDAMAALENSGNGSISNRSVAFTIYDRDGLDTLDLSYNRTHDRVDLNDQSFSDVSGLTGNLAIARGTMIEYFRGGSGNDTVTGNEMNNRISGNDGNDSLMGGDGYDTLYGGGGNDSLAGGSGKDLVSGNIGDDSLVGGTGDDTLYGGDGNDTLYG
ncbi:M10 family metallopeptidase C-terminal domain-containing protein, partial [Phycobacter sp. K97]|uniref:M10 family metallopeptidase C-terminal domain-containing protein n=1 Tax=Phycobacter sedimenti TaxID=3133977 RepID=UPI00311EB755